MHEEFTEASGLIEKLINEGFEAYLVGGCVRDHLLGRPIGDIDIATSATPEEVRSMFPNNIPVGIQHGTVIVRHHNQSYEVTTFRSEGTYLDRRHPSSVAYILSLEEDLSRRDFTINAMAMDVLGNIHDPFEGRNDLSKKIIQTVGKAEQRFLEDPLRIMRALRFSATLDFTLERKTAQACADLGKEISLIAVERLASEFIKLLRGTGASRCLNFMFEHRIADFLPGLSQYKENAEPLFRLSWEGFKRDEERWATLLLLLGVGDISAFLKSWKRSNALISQVEQLIESTALAKESLTPIQLYEWGMERALSSQRILNILKGMDPERGITELQIVYQALPIHSRKELAVNGNDVAKVREGEKGPWISALLAEIEAAVINKEIVNTKSAIIEWVRNWNER